MPRITRGGVLVPEGSQNMKRSLARDCIRIKDDIGPHADQRRVAVNARKATDSGRHP